MEEVEKVTRKLFILLAPLLVSLNTSLVLYAENYSTLLFSEIISSLLFSLAFAILLLALFFLVFKDEAVRSIFLALCLWLTLSYSGWKAFYNLVCRYISYALPMAGYVGLALFSTLCLWLVLKKKLGFQSRRQWLVSVGSITLWLLFAINTYFEARVEHLYQRALALYLVVILFVLGTFLRKFSLAVKAPGQVLLVLLLILYSVPSTSLLPKIIAQGRATSAAQIQAKLPASMTQQQVKGSATGQGLPDIYFFILDGYGRADMLKKLYGYDNSDFLRFLKEQGFYVGQETYSCYMRTHMSLSTTFNLEYCPPESLQGTLFQQTNMLFNAINLNRLVGILQQKGYRTVAFPVGMKQVEFQNADTFHENPSRLKPFETRFLAATIFNDLLPFFLPYDAFSQHRARFKNVWRKLPHREQGGAPAFVFAHILCPHPPFIFDAKGRDLYPNYGASLFDANDLLEHLGMSSKEYIRKYGDQLTYLNGLLKGKIKELLALPQKPIIIIQSDHGPGAFTNTEYLDKTNVQERFSIINAMYLGDKPKPFPEPFASVNTFRFVLNEVFGYDYPMLPNRAFFTPRTDLGRITEVTKKLYGKKGE